ncbi:hypothetical protein TNCV_857761 [Trichonephila clavipes]|nr:hypothetical protein TNCV_857761 [Trichonephila clavipes]
MQIISVITQTLITSFRSATRKRYIRREPIGNAMGIVFRADLSSLVAGGNNRPTEPIVSTSLQHYGTGSGASTQSCMHGSDGSRSHITNHIAHQIKSVTHHSVSARSILHR